MNFACLSPHFPPNYRAFWHRLRELGVTVLGIAEAPHEELGEHLLHTLSEYYRVPDMHDYDALVRAMGFFTWRHGHIDRLESHNEYWLETEAALRTDFNVWGPKLDEIQRVKRKSLMKEVFRQAGVAVAQGKVVRNATEARAAAKDLGFPLVIKPDIGVGAAGAARLDGLPDIDRFFDGKPPSDHMMEEFIEGSLVSFDGLTDHEGRIVFWTSHVFTEGILEIVRDDKDIYYYSVRDIDPAVEKAGRAAVAAFALRGRFFHIEFFKRHTDGQIMAVEVNMRPPGGLTTDMFNFANDIDVYREFANVAVHGRFEAAWARDYYCMYVGRKDHVRYRHAHHEVMGTAGDMLMHEERTQSAFARAIGDQAYMLRHPQLEPLVEVARYALEV